MLSLNSLLTIQNRAKFYFSLHILTHAKPDYDALILTPFVKNGSIELARTLSEVDSKNFLGVKSHSGFFTVKEKYDSNMFFWYFPHEKPAETPWILWLQGGPGFSSLYAEFSFFGPIEIVGDEIKRRNGSWGEDYSMLFIDNPVGSGFSYTGSDEGYPDNEDDVGDQLYVLLLQFLEVFPELREAPLFLAGESYAGKYLPALGIQIHRRMDKERPINFRGISIGNGLIDPRSMMRYSELCSVMGFVEGEDVDRLKELEQGVVKYIDEGKMIDAANKFNETVEFIKKQSGVSIYNFNQDPSNSGHDFEKFLERKDAREWLHVGSAPFDLDNQLVYTKMLADIMNTTKPFLEELLEHYGVLSYSGQLDIILPYWLSKQTYEVLEWSRREEYVQAPRKRLRNLHDQSIAAYKKAGGNFIEMLVRRSGHMVPMDQPEVAKCIIDSFIKEFK